MIYLNIHLNEYVSEALSFSQSLRYVDFLTIQTTFIPLFPPTPKFFLNNSVLLLNPFSTLFLF